MNPFDMACAVMSAAAYQEHVKEANQIAPPPGASQLPGALGHTSIGGISGFETSAYDYEGKIVIAYAGTNTEQLADLIADLALGLGASHAQLLQAAEFYLSIKNNPAYAGREIVFTGHSLGGGLAAAMGVFFNKQAVTFDPAPFRLAVTQQNASDIKAYLALSHPEWTVDSDFASFTTVEGIVGLSAPAASVALALALLPIDAALSIKVATLPYPITIRGEGNIKAYSVSGEFLTNGYKGLGSNDLNALRIQSASRPESIDLNPAGASLGIFDLHSMTLLVAAAREPRLATLFSQNPHLTEALFDRSLYFHRGSDTTTDFLVKLVQQEFGGAGSISGTGNLAKFADDLTRLVENVNGMASQPAVRQAVAVTAMEYYYFNPVSSTTALFTTAGNGIHFDYDTIGVSQIGLKSPRRLADALQPFLSAAEWDAVGYRLDTYEAWHVQSGDSGMVWTAGTSASDVAVGGAQTDILDGGAGDDILIGGAGQDFLTGGTGSDTLLGGQGDDWLYGGDGTDTYLISGHDTIDDADGQGVIRDGAGRLIGGAIEQRADGSYAFLDDPNITVSRGDVDITLGLGGGASVTIQGFADGALGLHIAQIADITTVTISGDKDYGSDPDHPLKDPWGNPAGNPTPGSDDTLSGSAGSDFIEGLGGRDQLRGQGGNDIIEGGSGIDIVAAGMGNDRLFGNAKIDLRQATVAGDTDNPTGLKGDWLNGGDGDDIVVAGADNDALFGGDGTDILIGGAGDDVLDGDDDYTALGFDWTITDYGNPFDRSFSPILIETAPAGAADVLYGGSGNDVMFGMFGADQLYGDADNDALSGDDGDDELFGGDGDDYLTGDYGKLAYDSGYGVVVQGNDSLDGGDGNDWMQGESGNDNLYGGGGNDSIWGDAITYAGAADGNDYLDGEDGDDQLVGGGGNDDIFGGVGNDILTGNAGTDHLDGEAGSDVLLGGDGDDRLFGGAGDDRLWGDDYASSAGADHLDGEDGDDLLMGYGGDDTLVGGLGKDTLLGGDGADQLSGDEGDDLLAGEGGDDFLEGGDGNDVIRGDDGDDVVDGDDGADLLYGLSGADVLDGGAGNDELQGGDDNDTSYGGSGDDLVVGQLGDDVLDGEAGNDEVQGNEGNDTVRGGTGNDVLFGLAGNDVVSGDDGNDYVDGGDGNDSLHGAAGMDWLLGANGNDTLDGGEGDDLLSGDSGVDTYLFGRGSGHDVIENYDPLYGASDGLRFAADVRPGDVEAQREGNDLVLRITDTGDSVTIRNQFLATRSTYNYWTGYTDYYDFRIGSIQFADGTTWPGTSIPLYHASATGSGTLSGSSYADVFGGSHGLSTYAGGSGSDIYNAGPRAGLVTVSDFGSSSDIDVLNLSPEITASDVKLDRVNTDMVIHLRDSPDRIVVARYFENSSNGIDRVLFQGDGRLWDRSTIAQQFLIATEQDDQLLGTTGDDALDGLGGNDSIDGGTGNDLLDGDAGNDLLVGGAGDDVYLFGLGSGHDTIAGEDSGSGALDAIVMKAGLAPVDVRLTRNGEDLVLAISAASDDLTVSDYFHDYGAGTAVGSVEQVRFGDGTVWDSAVIRTQLPAATNGDDAVYGYETNDVLEGLDGDDALYGGRGDDTLDGGAGNDSLKGGSGRNTYLFGAGSGWDTIDALDDLSVPMESTVRLGPDFTPQQIVGSRRGNDLILFMPGSTDQLIVLHQYATGDLQRYGIDQIIFDDGTAWDPNTIWSLGFSGLLRGTQYADSIVGTAGSDALYGYGGDDTLDGGAGSDTLTGGTGNDRYLVDSASDLVAEVDGEGIDTVLSSDTYALPANVENLTLAGYLAINGTGNALDNALVGNGASNALTGGAGNDTLDGAGGGDVLAGGLGSDTYAVDNATDIVTENVNEGIDTVFSSVTCTLSTNVENLILNGSAATNGTGNALANTLIGNAANNVLDGKAGADTLRGGAGDDTYAVDNPDDVVIEAANEGVDTVNSSITYTLAVNVENLTLTGTTAINGTGNGLGNVLAGNSGNNVLVGGLGDDTYVITSGDSIVENANDGIDTIVAGFSYTLGANLDNLTLTGTGRINGSGNALANVITGNGASNTLTGGAGDDRLVGGGGTDTLVGGTGNDWYEIDDSKDAVTESANEGTDTIQASFTYTLAANLENLVLAPSAAINGTGNTLNNVISGNALSNVLNGGVGADTLIGDAGDDTYVLDNAGDVVIENVGQGVDTVQASTSYALSTNVENLTLTGTSAINGTGNALNNVLTGNVAANVLTGAAGDDTYVVGTGDSVVERPDEGIDTVQSSATYTLGADLENLTLTGTATINGTGNALDNVLTGNSAANVLTGGKGNDTYATGSGDVVVENLDEGIDTVQSSVTSTLSVNVENLTLTGTSAINGTGNAFDNVLTGNGAANVLTGGAGNDIFVVGAGDTVVESVNGGIDTVKSSGTFALSANVENLTLTGAAATNATGNALNNVLLGTSANNVLDGGMGQDIMAGGAGDDIYFVDNIADAVIENPGEGIDTVQSTVSHVAGGNIENVTLLGSSAINATGDANNNILTGNSAANVLAGGAGNDTLIGGGGADTLIGGAGNDAYIVLAAGTTVVESAGEGTDTVQAGVSYTLGDDLENLSLTGTGNINGTGNSLANAITGNAGDNVLTGGGGLDSLQGGDGNDTLVGGAGAELNGGAGDDLYIIDGMSGYLFDYDGDFEANGSGIDTVQSGGTVWLWDYYYFQNGYGFRYVGTIENLVLTGVGNATGFGTDANNTITGNDGNNLLAGYGGDDTIYGGSGDDELDGGDGSDTLDGGSGNDLLRGYQGANVLKGGSGNDTLDGSAYSGSSTQLLGGTGDDQYLVYTTNDVITENANEGTDTVVAGYGGYALGANLENLVISYGLGGVTATGNALSNGMTGNDLANTLNGAGGDDTLDGGAGADTLIGGTGNDSYVVDIAGDVVSENANEGTDTVRTSISYVLGANLENLTLIGSGAINGTGNTVDNVLTGNSAANVLTGGLGNDTYVADSLDTIVENANEGTDTVKASFSYALGANLENLTLTGAMAINGTGNATANVITGNGVNNVLDGGIGADTLIGGPGDDTYVVDNTADMVVESVSEGTDTVQSAVTFALATNVENLTLLGSQAINGTGNAMANVLVGNAAANVLAGGLGDDTYVVIDTLDTVVENANEGVDTLQSSITRTLGANLENLVLTGSGVANGYGNTLANTLTGNDAANTLAGGLGDDTYLLNDYADTILENISEGTDTVVSSIGYALSANVENLVLTGSVYAGTGNSLANTITGNGYSNVLDGGSGVDTMIGGNGNDTYVVDNVGDAASENANEGTDTVQSSVSYMLAANVENLTLTGSAAIDGSGNALNNTLTGNSGVNTLAGGAGDDTYVIGTGDIVNENAIEGIDVVQIDVTYTLGTNVENLTLTGWMAINGTGNGLDNVLTGNSAANVLTGGAGNDTYDIGIGDTVVELANQGFDTVRSIVTWGLGANVENLTLIDGAGAINGTGNGLDNVLTGNNFANVLSGGAGNDTYVVAAGDTVVESADQGIDTVMSTVSYLLSDNSENLTLTGAAAINATGNGLDNILTGNVASNTLDGGLGADRMAGGSGDDIYWVDNVGDVIAENANAGIDTVRSFIDYSLGANLENLSLNSVQAATGTGNELNNVLIGTTADNVLIGLGGDDTLDGGMGADTMIGGVGNDTYVVNGVDDVIVERADEGTDTVQSRFDYVLGADLENLTLLGIAAVHALGNEANNVLIGSVGNNVLDGGAGSDTLRGGRGDDCYVVDNVGDTVTEVANEGTDIVVSSVTFTLGANVENLTLTGADAINGTGNASDNVLTGNSAANALTGGDGANYLDGGLGADSLIAGWGNDSYVVDDAGDTIQDTGGYDTVLSSVSFALSSSLENLTLTGSNAVDGSGNDYDNILIGNSSANVLDGGALADTMFGAASNDTYVVDDLGDRVCEYVNEGIDTVRSSVGFVLGVNLENLELTGSAAINGTDNALDNTLIGNAANNQLSADTGNDILIGAGGADRLADRAGDNILIGGAGDDTLEAGSGADLIAFNLGDGRDTLASAGGGGDTLSIGGGVGYTSMTFDRSGSDLLFSLGAGDQIVLKDWYASAARRGVAHLQVMAQAMSDFSPGGADPLRDNKIEQFDFSGLVDRFDRARAADPSIARWALSDALSEFHTSGSDTTAVGGEVVLQYGLYDQTPAVGGTSTLVLATPVSTSEASILRAVPPNALMTSSVDPLFALSADVAAPSDAIDQEGATAQWLLTEHRLSPSTATHSDNAAVSTGAPEDGALPPSIDAALHGAPSASVGAVTRGSSEPDASSPSSRHGASAGYGLPSPDPGGASVKAGDDAWELQASPSAEPRALNPPDALNARIERALDQWIQAKGTSQAIRLSHYEEVLRGQSDVSEDARSDNSSSVSYAGHWQRLQFLLDQHVSMFGDASSADFGSQVMLRGAMESRLGDGAEAASRTNLRNAAARTPLPMFSGLQDGFDRL